ncbi:hypothetical protein PHYSODRAFT_286914 [Phytophthora sojae]|uniref:Uncharacterized protein n=1 Tax=Phytophthora sojae (strain P6497) TaxID=1094619 RepID=G4ZYK6_PHYSP|nr:hypothetical protein PHYSODRAFT_286914 [Phytophthora sojae]EGZ12039.1 hypothetical protein PHYSODRAFT_286914 [Phytophthora sojae]|eukprot:XP_009532372.1 hypothetical protein PHYSODRAFT_286914 [Phytophthora sojae]
MLRAPPFSDREPPAPTSPASAHALLSLMQSVAPPRASAPWKDDLTTTATAASSLTSSPAGKSDAAEEEEEEAAPPKVKAKTKRQKAAKTDEKDTEPKPKKQRKRTYYMRKEELAVLSKEYEKLQKEMQQYRRQNDALEDRERMRRREEENRGIRQVIHSQRLAFANTQSMIAQYMRVQEHSPFETFIQLGKDPVERHATLLSMKKKKLHDALQFLVARRRFMDPSTPFSDNQKFENAHGDFCYMGFDVTPFAGIRSARTVFDVLLNFSYNLEISLSELLGDITIRENDDHWDPSVSQQRLVTNVANVAEMETNNAMFSEYHERNGPAALGVELPNEWEDLGATGHGDELGVLAIDFVNEDELYPYIPGRRIRQDVTVLMLVSTCTRPKSRPVGYAGPIEMERVVILTRWSLLRIRKSSIHLPFEATQRIRNGIEQVGEAMLNNVRYALTPRDPIVPSGDLPTSMAPPAMAAMLPPPPNFGSLLPPISRRY